jgi:hypothetical protein
MLTPVVYVQENDKDFTGNGKDSAQLWKYTSFSAWLHVQFLLWHVPILHTLFRWLLNNQKEQALHEARIGLAVDSLWNNLGLRNDFIYCVKFHPFSNNQLADHCKVTGYYWNAHRCHNIQDYKGQCPTFEFP